MYELEDNKRIQADDIYKKQAPHKVKCPGSAECIGNVEEEHKCKSVEGRCELGNKYIKHWKCLCCPFVARDRILKKVEKHRQLFYACAVITQVSMEMGYNELWDLGPNYN